MMTLEKIKQLSRKYFKISLWITFGLFLVGLLLVQLKHMPILVNSLLFTTIYTLVINFAYGKSWQVIAYRSPNVLSRFYMAASVIRILLALVVILVAVVLFRNDKPQMLSFIGVFASFYIVLLAFDSVFFARVEKIKE